MGGAKKIDPSDFAKQSSIEGEGEGNRHVSGKLYKASSPTRANDQIPHRRTIRNQFDALVQKEDGVYPG